MKKNSGFKILECTLGLVFLTSTALGANLCDNAQNAELAKKQLTSITQLADKEGLTQTISSSRVDECNPLSFVTAAYPSTQGITMSNLCAPIFRFASEADLKKFAQIMKFVLPTGVLDSTCAEVVIKP